MPKLNYKKLIITITIVAIVTSINFMEGYARFPQNSLAAQSYAGTRIGFILAISIVWHLISSSISKSKKEKEEKENAEKDKRQNEKEEQKESSKK